MVWVLVARVGVAPTGVESVAQGTALTEILPELGVVLIPELPLMLEGILVTPLLTQPLETGAG